MTSDDSAFQPYVADVDFDGVKFKFKIFTELARDQHDRRPGDPSYRDDVNATFYGYEQLVFIRDRMIQGGDTIFDVGGEYGFTTSVFALCAGIEGRVLTIEAHPWMASLIAQNTPTKLASQRQAVERGGQLHDRCNREVRRESCLFWQSWHQCKNCSARSLRVVASRFHKDGYRRI